MKRKPYLFSLLLSTQLLSAVSLAIAATEPQKLRIVYSSFSGAYTPLWIAVEERLGRKNGLDLDSVYAGRTNPDRLLMSGDAQYIIATGTGVVSFHAVGVKDLVIIASFLNVTGFSLFTQPQISNVSDLRGKVIGSGRPGAVTDVMLHYVLRKKLNLDPVRDVKVVPMGDSTGILPALEKKILDGAVLSTPTRLIAKKMGYREILDFDELGIPYPYVGVSTVKAHVKKNPEMTIRVVRTLMEGIKIFKTNKETSMAVMKKYLRGASNDILEETYRYFSDKIQMTPYPSLDAVRTALDMMSDQYPQAKTVDPNEAIDISFVKQIEGGASR